jgi:hypothetical protein
MAVIVMAVIVMAFVVVGVVVVGSSFPAPKNGKFHSKRLF